MANPSNAPQRLMSAEEAMEEVVKRVVSRGQTFRNMLKPLLHHTLAATLGMFEWSNDPRIPPGIFAQQALEILEAIAAIENSVPFFKGQLLLHYTHFEYTPLANPGCGIRLIRLFPGSFRDPITCEITHAVLKTNESRRTETPKYYALSYVWGDPDATHTIICNGRPLMVAANLFCALLNIRNMSLIHGKMLWMDALCINQTDHGEKNVQVARMTDIYLQAKRTIVWLGPGGIHDPFEPLCQLKEITGPALLEDSGHETADVQRFNRFRNQIDTYNLAQLFHNKWFIRKWCLQEFVLGWPVIFIQGKHSFADDKLFKVLIAYPDFTKWISLIIADETIVEAFIGWGLFIMMLHWALGRQYSSKEQETLHLLLIQSSRCETTKIQDSIYALNGLISLLSTTKITPNYDMDIADIFLQVIDELILSAKKHSEMGIGARNKGSLQYLRLPYFERTIVLSGASMNQRLRIIPGYWLLLYRRKKTSFAVTGLTECQITATILCLYGRLHDQLNDFGAAARKNCEQWVPATLDTTAKWCQRNGYSARRRFSTPALPTSYVNDDKDPHERTLEWRSYSQEIPPGFPVPRRHSFGASQEKSPATITC